MAESQRPIRIIVAAPRQLTTDYLSNSDCQVNRYKNVSWLAQLLFDAKTIIRYVNILKTFVNLNISQPRMVLEADLYGNLN